MRINFKKRKHDVTKAYLLNNPNLVSHCFGIEQFEVHTVEEHGSLSWIVPTLDQADDGTFATSTRTYDCCRFICGDAEGQAVKNGCGWSCRIAERYLLQH